MKHSVAVVHLGRSRDVSESRYWVVYRKSCRGATPTVRSVRPCQTSPVWFLAECCATTVYRVHHPTKSGHSASVLIYLSQRSCHSQQYHILVLVIQHDYNCTRFCITTINKQTLSRREGWYIRENKPGDSRLFLCRTSLHYTLEELQPHQLNFPASYGYSFRCPVPYS